VFVVWGGAQPGLLGLLTALGNGQGYEPGSMRWSAMNASGAPSARIASLRHSGWAARIASGRVLLLGGHDDPLLGAASVQKNGAVYDTRLDSWSAVSSWPSAEDQLWAAAAWTGSEFVLWGGLHGTTPSAAGERWHP
jgi:hypothetical protein